MYFGHFDVVELLHRRTAIHGVIGISALHGVLTKGL